MTTMSVQDAAKRAAEVEDTVAKIMRSMVDLEIEDKRAILTELDRWVSMEEASNAIAAGQQH
jgi:hypothetical protein